MDNQLQIIVAKSGLDSTKAEYILGKFQDYFKIAAEWEKKAKAIVVTDESQTVDMAIARTGRLFLREKRIAVEKSRKELKEQSLREGKAIDGIANVLKALIVPIEEHLYKQEKYVEIKQEEEEAGKRREVERIMEEERIAKEQAEREEQEKMRLENEKLRKEAIAKELQFRKEGEKAVAERKAIEDKAREELLKQQRKAETERKIVIIKARQKERALMEKQITCPHCGKTFPISGGEQHGKG